MNLRDLARRILPARMYGWVYRLYSRRVTARPRPSYAQEGEDMVLRAHLERLGRSHDGFYVDVGAHHPRLHSNTCYFWQQGWRGINVDPIPGGMRAFDRERPRDINVECGIAPTRGRMTFHVFDVGEYNTFDADLAARREARGNCRLLQKVSVPTMPLAELLDQHLPDAVAIDFLAVDAEGTDLDVLRSNDWTKYRPRLLLVECLAGMLDTAEADDDVAAFLRSQGYRPVAKTGRTVIFAEPS